MGQLNLVKCTNPLDRREREFSVAPFNGETLLEIKNVHCPSDYDFIVSVNGKIVPAEVLDRTVPSKGDCVVFVPKLENGEGLRIGLSIVVAIIGAVVGTYAAGPIGGYLGSQLGGAIGGALVSAAINIVGGLLINALLPIKAETMSMDRLDDSKSQVYSWNPSTVQQLGIPIPRIYGVNKVYGNVISTFIEDFGANQYLNVLLSLGMGPVNRIYDYYLNDQPIDNFREVDTPQARHGDISQTAVMGFDDTILDFQSAQKVVYGSPITYTVAGTDVDGLRVEITFPSGLWHQNTTTGEMEMNWVDLSVEYSSDGGANWNAITQQAGSWTWDEYARWSAGRWVWMTVRDMGVNDIGLVWYEVEAGTTDEHDHYDGEYHSEGNSWKWWGAGVFAITSATLSNYVTIIGSETTSIRRIFTVQGLAAGTYQVRVTKLTAERSSLYYGDDVYLTIVSEVYGDGYTYPRQALVGIRALATNQLSGSLRFSCMVEGMFVRVYDGASWSIAYSNNPAWVAFDVLTQPVYSGTWAASDYAVIRYDGYDPSQIDVDAFKTWADWCDSLVPDGSGGTEKRCMFDGVFDSETNAWDAFLTVCIAGRAAPRRNGSQISVIIDKTETASQLFSVGNIGIDSFKETFLPYDDRANEIEIDFVNQENGYQRETQVIYHDTGGSGSKARLQLVGVTRPSEAWRAGMLRLYNNKYIGRQIEFECDVDALACQVGDVVNIQHDVPQWGYGGRIVSADANTVTLDQSVTIEADYTYQIMIRLTDDTLVTKTISDGAGTYTTLTVSSVFTSIPSQYDPFAFGKQNILAKPFRVVAITRSGDLQFTITALEYNASIYNIDSDLPAVATYNYSDLDPIASVSALSATEQLVKTYNRVETQLIVAFQVPGSSMWTHAEIWSMHTNDQIYRYHGTSNSGKFIINNASDGVTYTIKAISVNLPNAKENFANAPSYSLYVYGKTAPPSSISQIWANASMGGLILTWIPVSDVDIDYYAVRYNKDTGAGTWDNSLEVGRAYGSTITLPYANEGLYLVKAIDTTGHDSNTAAQIIADDIPSILNFENHVTLNEDPAWTGTKTNMFKAGDYCYLDIGATDTFDVIADFDAFTPLDYYGAPGSATGYYETAATDLGSIQTVKCTGTVQFSAMDFEDLFDNITDLDARTNFDGRAESITVQLQIAVSQDAATYADWQPFIAGDYTGMAFKFRVKCASSSAYQTVYLSDLEFTIDFPERVESGQDVAIDVSGTAISFSKAYIVKNPIIRIIIQDASAGDTYKLTGIGLSGFTIQILNGGSGVARTIDWYATGY